MSAGPWIFCGGVTGAVLGQGACVSWCRGPDSTYCQDVPQLQLFFKDVEIHPVAVHLSVDVPVVQLQGPQVQFCGGGRCCVAAATRSSCWS